MTSSLADVAHGPRVFIDANIFVYPFSADSRLWWSHFYVFAILAESPASKQLGSTFAHLQDSWINVVVGGLAASVGSLYWHDQLDKVRNLKGVAQEMRKLAA